MDNVDKTKRSQIMKSITGTGTKPENIVFSWLLEDFPKTAVFRNCKEAIGSPDFFFPSFSGFLFIDGAFWHGHSKAFKFGKSGEYWDNKIATNIERDRKVDCLVRQAGGFIMRIWDFDIIKKSGNGRQKIKRWVEQCLAKTSDGYKNFNDMRRMAPFWEVFGEILSRQEAGVEEYGDDSYKKLDLFDEINEELSDVIVYSYLQMLKVRELKIKYPFLSNKNLFKEEK